MGSTSVRTRCPKCEKSLRIDPQLMGKSVRCAGCHETFVVSSVSFAGSGEFKKMPSATPDPRTAQVAGETPAADASLEAYATRMNSGGSAETFGGAKPAAAPAPPPAGKLGRFELHEVLGRGGFGVVYRASDRLLDRHVALKIPLFATTERGKAQRFLNEAKAAARLRHPNIVAVYEGGEVDGRLYLAAEYVKGETLAQRMKNSRPSLAQAVAWVKDLAGALAYAHAQGIVHRDIKPHNVMIGANGRPQIMDFGLARRLDDDSKMTREGALLGTPAYMAPEQARGEIEKVGPHSDQYSLGAVLYELITGQKPFDGPPAVVIAKAASEEPPAPRTINSEIPLDLEAICQKAMEKDTARRYENLIALAADLAHWEQGEPTAARPLTAIQRTRHWVRRSPAFATLVLTVAVLLVLAATGSGVGAFLLSQSNDELESALAGAQEQSQKAAAEAEKAARATKDVEKRTEEADAETKRAELAQSENEKALADLEAAMERRTTVEKELASVGAEREKAAEKSTESKARLKDVESQAATVEEVAEVAKWREYAATLEGVIKELADGNFEAAREQLLMCDEKLRGWEWDYLDAAVKRKSRDIGPRVVSVPEAVTRRGEEVVTVKAISGDGLLMAGCVSIGRGGFDHVRIFKIPGSGQAELISTLDVTGYRVNPWVSFSRDGKWLCVYDSKKKVVLRCPLDRKKPRFDASQFKKWQVPTDRIYKANWTASPVDHLREQMKEATAAFEAFNDEASDEGSQVILPRDTEIGPDENRSASVDLTGILKIQRKGLTKPLLAIPTKESLSTTIWTGAVFVHPVPATIFWVRGGTRLIVAGRFKLGEDFVNSILILDAE